MTDKSNPSPGGWPTPSESEDLRRKLREVKSGLTISIYALLDPRDGRVRYVGACRDPKGNVRKLLFDAKRRRIGYVFDWLRDLRAAGLRPSVTLVREVLQINAKDEIKALKTTIHFTDSPRRQRGPALKFPHDLTRDTPMIHEDFHCQGRSTPDTRDKYVRALKANLRKYGPKLKSIRHSKFVLPANTPEMRELARKTARMILKSKT